MPLFEPKPDYGRKNLMPIGSVGMAFHLLRLSCNTLVGQEFSYWRMGVFSMK
jgi:hypothetical protein